MCFWGRSMTADNTAICEIVGGHRPPLQSRSSRVTSKRSDLLPRILLGAGLMAHTLLAGPTATLTGRVTDPSGCGIAGVKLEAINGETNVGCPSQTNEEVPSAIPN